MKKSFLSGLCLLIFFALSGGISNAQTAHPNVSSCQFTNTATKNIADDLKGAVEDLSQRTPYSSTWRTSNGKIIIRYSSQVINKLDANGNRYTHLAITGPTSYWNGGSTPSCIYPNYNTDSILITIPAGIRISFFTINYSYTTNVSISIPMNDGVFYLSTPCGQTDTLKCDENQPGSCYLAPNVDFSSLLTPCIVPNCNNTQSFWLDAHLARFAGGAGCDTTDVWYSAFPFDSQHVFSAYVEGNPAINIAKNLTAQIGPCNGTIKVTASGGTPPYTYLWSPNNQTTDSIGGLCSGTYCCMVTDSDGCNDSTCIYLPKATGVADLANSGDIYIYPNPSSGVFTFQAKSDELGAKSIVEVYNMIGQQVYSNSFSINNSQFTINLANQPNGVYLYRVMSDNGSLLGDGKLIIQK